MQSTITVLPNNKATILDNVSCAYCGREETPDNLLTNDHVIGRRFVPKGSFAKGWSLVVRACFRCNNEKSDLEDDISAITLHPWRGPEKRDPAVADHARRKALGSFSRLTGKPISKSFDEQTISGRLMNAVDVSFNLITPPQLDAERVAGLARMHLQAFFYLMSYNIAARKGGFLPGAVGILSQVSYSDWGNSQIMGFAELTRAWDARAFGGGANGHFRIMIRLAPTDTGLWSFALEWNASFRVIGFFGDLIAARKHVNALPDLEWKRIDANRRYRQEAPIDPEKDVLFVADDELISAD
jgi:hypothetical protein